MEWRNLCPMHCCLSTWKFRHSQCWPLHNSRWWAHWSECAIRSLTWHWPVGIRPGFSGGSDLQLWWNLPGLLHWWAGNWWSSWLVPLSLPWQFARRRSNANRLADRHGPKWLPVRQTRNRCLSARSYKWEAGSKEKKSTGSSNLASGLRFCKVTKKECRGFNNLSLLVSN